jgi:hypothetical protein
MCYSVSVYDVKYCMIDVYETGNKQTAAAVSLEPADLGACW